MSKGLAYTPFALIAATIIVSMAFTSINNVDTGTADFSTMDSVGDSWEETQASYAVDSLDTISREASTPITEQEVYTAASGLTETGVYNSVQERNSTYLNWSSSVTEQLPVQKISVRDMETSVDNLTVRTSSTLEAKSSQGAVNYSLGHTTSIIGVQDPLLDNTTYSRDINSCSFEHLAVRLYDGEISSGTVRGDAVVEPQDITSITSQDSKILITSDVTGYDQSEVEDFLGYFSVQEPVSPDNYNDNYTAGTSAMPNVDSGDQVIIHSGFWESNFETGIETGCYMPSSLEETPDFTDRLNEQASGDSAEGIFTVISPSPSQSSIAYERISSRNLNLVEIETVSETREWPDFRISEQLAESIGMDELIK